MKFFQNFWDSQIFLGFYRFAWLSILRLTATSKRPKSMLWVSESICRLRLTLWDKFGGYRKHSEVDFDAGKCTFRSSKKWNFFKIFEILKISLDFTDLHGYQFWDLQWVLGIQKVCCGYLKVSSDFAGHFETSLEGIGSILRYISKQENALFDRQKMKFFQNFEIPKFSLDFPDLHGYRFWDLQWLLSVQRVCCGYLKVSSDVA